MTTKTKKKPKKEENLTIGTPLTRHNPLGMDHNNKHRVKSVEATEEYTRIDFIYKSSKIWDNGGWIQIEGNSYIQAKGSSEKYTLIKAIGIPLAPTKHYFKRKGQHFEYTLIFPALPKSTTCIDIIERKAPGTYFNFFDVHYAEWMTIPHAAYLPGSNN